jgi:hypothetical protein
MDRRPVSLGQLRSFGYIMALVFGALGVLYYVKANEVWIPFALVSGVLCLSALFARRLLEPFYRGWMAFGAVLAWINTRIVLGVVFYVIITPIALVIRVMRKDLLDERIDRNKESYWKRRTEAPSPESMERQF